MHVLRRVDCHNNHDMIRLPIAHCVIETDWIYLHLILDFDILLQSFELLGAVLLHAGVGGGEGWQLAEPRLQPRDGGELGHVHIEPLSVVHLGKQL